MKPFVIWSFGELPDLSFVTALARCLGIPTELRPVGDWAGAACILVADAPPNAIESLGSLPIPTLAAISGFAPAASGAESHINLLPSRNTTLWKKGFGIRSVIGRRPTRNSNRVQGSAVAVVDGMPVWSVSYSGTTSHEVVSFELPTLGSSTDICDVCKGSNLFRAIPVVAFLKSVITGSGWCPPPLRACFMFDDPNLHGSTYGFIDYAELANHAHQHNYHVSMATVPLDGWYVSRKAVGIFKQSPEQLSLLVHGNDHTVRELAQPLSPTQRRRLVRSALARIQRLEQKAGLPISRVMAAPHGACTDAMLSDMAALGFEAACISPWSLRDYNPGRPWLQQLGVATSEIIGGLPVIPRFRLSSDCLPQALVASLLDQPIVAVGHHQNLASGLGVLGRLADSFHALGEIRWMDMQSIARTNYWTRADGAAFHVRSFSRSFQIDIPVGVTTLFVELPGFGPASICRCVTWTSGQPPRILSVAPGGELPVQGGDRVSVQIQDHPAADLDGVSVGDAGAIRPWPFLRRLLSEARDRALPLVSSRRARAS